MKRLLSIMVLAALTLHGCTQLGVIGYLYSHRHEMAYTLGLTAEQTISLCSADYFRQNNFCLSSETHEKYLGQESIQTEKINLYFKDDLLKIFAYKRCPADNDINTVLPLKDYTSPPSSIFRPPAA